MIKCCIATKIVWSWELFFFLFYDRAACTKAHMTSYVNVMMSYSYDISWDISPSRWAWTYYRLSLYRWFQYIYSIHLVWLCSSHAYRSAKFQWNFSEIPVKFRALEESSSYVPARWGRTCTRKESWESRGVKSRQWGLRNFSEISNCVHTSSWRTSKKKTKYCRIKFSSASVKLTTIFEI